MRKALICGLFLSLSASYGQTQTCTITLDSPGTINLPYIGTATPSAAAPGGIFPTRAPTINFSMSTGCGTAQPQVLLPVGSQHWLQAAVLYLGFVGPNGTPQGVLAYWALANTNSASRLSGVTIVVPGAPAPASLDVTVTEEGSTLTEEQRAIVAMYQSLLLREPDQGGFDFWSGHFGGILEGFLQSQEFMARVQ
ncbi:MAG TPA: DUF4214 domain-containing protein [Bryobacteraceae bacterium]|nr:DUF4214 domain-containing protein [Bryobacteraceae bacterium]